MTCELPLSYRFAGTASRPYHNNNASAHIIIISGSPRTRRQHRFRIDLIKIVSARYLRPYNAFSGSNLPCKNRATVRVAAGISIPFREIRKAPAPTNYPRPINPARAPAIIYGFTTHTHTYNNINVYCYFHIYARLFLYRYTYGIL